MLIQFVLKIETAAEILSQEVLAQPEKCLELYKINKQVAKILIK